MAKDGLQLRVIAASEILAWLVKEALWRNHRLDELKHLLLVIFWFFLLKAMDVIEVKKVLKHIFLDSLSNELPNLILSLIHQLLPSWAIAIGVLWMLQLLEVWGDAIQNYNKLWPRFAHVKLWIDKWKGHHSFKNNLDTLVLEPLWFWNHDRDDDCWESLLVQADFIWWIEHPIGEFRPQSRLVHLRISKARGVNQSKLSKWNALNLGCHWLCSLLCQERHLVSVKIFGVLAPA